MWMVLRAAPDSEIVRASPVETQSSPLATPTWVASEGPSSFAAGTAPPASTLETGRSLLGILELLPVRPEDRTGYQRSLFVLWTDADGDRCNTRSEVLIEEAVLPPSVGPGCRLTGGRWRSLYDGFETSNPARLDIDHVVPLAEAWDSGASAWTADRRTRFANDLGVSWSLVAVSASSNRAKGDRDPADWMPPLAAVRCTYVADWLAVKVRWSLAIDAREHDFLDPIARACPAVDVAIPAP